MHSKLTKPDLLQAFTCIQTVAAARDHDELVAGLIRVLHPLMRAKVTGYNETDPARKRFAFVVHPRHIVSDAMIRTWVNHARDNPLVQHAMRHPRDLTVHKITDFMPQKMFRRTVLCQKIYSKMGAEYQIALRFPPAGSAAVALVFNRAFDFTERDRQILSLLQPVLGALYANVQKLTDLAADQSNYLTATQRPSHRDRSKHHLSRRELDVLRPLLRGESNKQIAANLELSNRTVEKYVEHLLRKLKVHTRAAACAKYQSFFA